MRWNSSERGRAIVVYKHVLPKGQNGFSLDTREMDQVSYYNASMTNIKPW